MRFGKLATSVCVAVAAVVTGLTTGSPAHATTPGTLIDMQAQSSGWRSQPNGHVVKYVTTGPTGNAVKASGALFVPAGSPPATGWPIVAYDHGTSGMASGCGGQTNTGNAYPNVLRIENEFIDRFVAKGYAVVAPDYVGLGVYDTGPHPYLNSYSEATATIDLVRAARTAIPTLSKDWVAVGISQGGHAALNSAHLQRRYAPD